MSNRYQQIKADELHKSIDELLYLNKQLSKSLIKDSEKLAGLNQSFDFGKTLLGGAQNMLQQLKHGRAGKNKLLLLGIVIFVMFVLWLI